MNKLIKNSIVWILCSLFSFAALWPLDIKLMQIIGLAFLSGFFLGILQAIYSELVKLNKNKLDDK